MGAEVGEARKVRLFFRVPRELSATEYDILDSTLIENTTFHPYPPLVGWEGGPAPPSVQPVALPTPPLPSLNRVARGPMSDHDNNTAAYRVPSP
jgi:hypothetical protein